MKNHRLQELKLKRDCASDQTQNSHGQGLRRSLTGLGSASHRQIIYR
jgi:hypothetical protein